MKKSMSRTFEAVERERERERESYNLINIEKASKALPLLCTLERY